MSLLSNDQKANFSQWLVSNGIIKASTPMGEATAAHNNEMYQRQYLNSTGNAQAMTPTKVAVGTNDSVTTYQTVAGDGLLGTTSVTLIFANATGSAVKYYAFDADGFRLANTDDASRAAATGGSWGATTGARVTSYTGYNPIYITQITYNSLNATSVNLEFVMVNSGIDGTQAAKPINFASQVSPFQNQPGIYKFPYSATIDGTKMLRLTVAANDTVSVTFDIKLQAGAYGMIKPM